MNVDQYASNVLVKSDKWLWLMNRPFFAYGLIEIGDFLLISRYVRSLNRQCLVVFRHSGLFLKLFSEIGAESAK
jgi:hypothetical protein